MAQDDPNEPIVVEELQTSEQSHAKRVNPTGAETTPECETAEPTVDDAEYDAAEEEADAEDATRDETTETESPSQDDTADAAPSSSATPPTQSNTDADADDRCEIEKQPYDCAPHHAA